MKKYPKILSWHKLHPEITLASRVFVTEKLDGANMRVLVKRGEDLVFGSRDMKLGTLEGLGNFFKGRPQAWWSVPEHRAAAYRVLDVLGVDEVLIFGEVVGWGIQKRIAYFPSPEDVHFFAFDIMIDDKFLRYQEFIQVCLLAGLPYVPVLYDGSPRSDDFQALIKRVMAGEQKSALAHAYGRDAPAEGVVIRTEPLFITTLNSYSIAKLKAPKFEEVEQGKEVGERKVEATGAGGDLLIDFINTYITEGRLHNILVRLRGEGKVSGEMKDLKVIIPAYWEDLVQECGEEVNQVLQATGLSERDLLHRVGKKVQLLYSNLLKKEGEGQ